MKKYFPEDKATEWTRNPTITISQDETSQKKFSAPQVLSMMGSPMSTGEQSSVKKINLSMILESTFSLITKD